jgi:pimeloyl-ACP methyl ester carboxylesterase
LLSSTSDLPPVVREHKVLVASSPHRIEMQVLKQLPPPQRPPPSFSGVPDPLNLWTTKDAKTNKKKKKPILLFLHGSFHGAWCYKEHWFHHFVRLGYPVAALSWRGTGATCAGPGVSKVKIDEHVHDLRTVLQQLPSLVFGKDGDDDALEDPINRGVVLVSHSFGGLAVMKLFEAHPELLASSVAPDDPAYSTAPPPIVGVVTMCSVPPSGNGPMTLRYVRRSWKQSWKITAGFAMKKCCDDPALCRELFFGGGGSADNDNDDDAQAVNDDGLKRYQAYFRRDSEATIDLLDLAKQLPIAKASKKDGTAPFVSMLPPCLVVGASRDYIVDREGVLETARYFGVLLPSSSKEGSEDSTSKDESGLVIVESPHDVMLGKDWRNGARAIERWLLRNGL